MRSLRTLLLATCLASAAAAAQDFVAISYHDLVDDPGDLAYDGATLASLVQQLDWLKANGYRAVSADDVLAAHSGRRPLPDKAVLLTFDDGYLGFYEDVYPLLKAFGYPAVLAVVSSWLDVPAGGTVQYGDRPVPRERFITWEMAREMAASGLVEIASHSHDLHHGVVANAQGNALPAAVARRFDAAHGVESERAYAARIRADLARSVERIAARTGKRPRVMVWPFGRYNATTVGIAQDLGFRLALTLDPEVGDARAPLTVGRAYLTRDPDLADLKRALEGRRDVPVLRGLCLRVDDLHDGSAEEAALGKAIDKVRALAPTAVLLRADAASAASGGLSVWFPGTRLPMRADYFGRAAWQLRTRAGVQVLGWLPLASAREGGEPTAAYGALGRTAPIDGLVIGDAPLATQLPPAGDAALATWDPRAPRRARAESAASPAARDALSAVAGFTAEVPAALILDALPLDALPPPRDTALQTADYLAVQTAGDPRAALARLDALGWLSQPYADRLVWWSDFADPAGWDAVATAGIRNFVYCPASLPDEATLARLAPAISGAVYPHRPD
jgi:peptidoglycan/xylan/chitin deacetylase (PgdA/CDA1 family)